MLASTAGSCHWTIVQAASCTATFVGMLNFEYEGLQWSVTSPNTFLRQRFDHATIRKAHLDLVTSIYRWIRSGEVNADLTKGVDQLRCSVTV